MSVIDPGVIDGVIDPDNWDDNVGGSGKSMNQLGDEWWIRAFGTPEDSNPFVKDDFTDPRGRRGSVERANEFNAGVPDPIFFLGGTFSSIEELLSRPQIERTVLVPEGDVLVFPTINTAEPDAYDRLPDGTFPDEGTTRLQVNDLLNNNPVSFEVKVGTVEVSEDTVGSLAYRVDSPKGGFSYEIPENTWVRDPDTGQIVPPQTVEPAVADGYWFAYDTKSLLSREDHTVNFIGRLPGLGFELDVKYNILNPIEGNNRKNKLRGTHGKDYIDGKNGKDKLLGFGGDDLLIGGNGKDTIDGGIGDDELWGDNGKDTFIFKRGYGQDTIFDFARKEVVKIKGFRDYKIEYIPGEPMTGEPGEEVSPRGIGETRISFIDYHGDPTGDTLTFVNVASDDLSINLPHGRITLL